MKRINNLLKNLRGFGNLRGLVWLFAGRGLQPRPKLMPVLSIIDKIIPVED